MRSVEEIVLETLKTVSQLGGRVFPLVAPQDVTSPFAGYTIISKFEDFDFDGGDGLNDVYLQVDVYAFNVQEAVKIDDSCRAALVALAECNCKTETFGRHNYEGDTKLYRVSSDYRILVESED
ncbi:MAG: DUF3168 domain-containing protein [Burkholderiales bacterium]|jgi:hypothetical protein|nr:DUF3168 domain-containing protein [Burkholderiales bacterium]